MTSSCFSGRNKKLIARSLFWLWRHYYWWRHLICIISCIMVQFSIFYHFMQIWWRHHDLAIFSDFFSIFSDFLPFFGLPAVFDPHPQAPLWKFLGRIFFYRIPKIIWRILIPVWANSPHYEKSYSRKTLGGVLRTPPPALNRVKRRLQNYYLR